MGLAFLTMDAMLNEAAIAGEFPMGTPTSIVQ
jgi:hypothetical protein